ncbi:hypothetical protein ILYODFUR_005464 [Ilyodon furcidens]|uniref:Uncharacterized protein n=1 Tax=Ilyodon furcidens TaxID=33524 RepID=A0ABV0TS70_9TELE
MAIYFPPAPIALREESEGERGMSKVLKERVNEQPLCLFQRATVASEKEGRGWRTRAEKDGGGHWKAPRSCPQQISVLPLQPYTPLT